MRLDQYFYPAVRKYDKKGSIFTQGLQTSYHNWGKPRKHKEQLGKLYEIQGLNFVYSNFYTVSYLTDPPYDFLNHFFLKLVHGVKVTRSGPRIPGELSFFLSFLGFT